MPPRIKVADSTKLSAFDTEDLRKQLVAFLAAKFPDPTPAGEQPMRVGNYKWGVYAFFDYDDEPIYVGQTKEMLSTRIRRHLTNQRTDAVAMSVLDPFEVCRIEVWPLPQFQHVRDKKDVAEAQKHLNALERKIYDDVVSRSEFKAVLNEKDPPATELVVAVPPSFSLPVVSDEIYALRSHPDLRLARRAQVIAKLAQVIAERKVQNGLRRVLLTQAKRLENLAKRRFEGCGGDGAVEKEPTEGVAEEDDSSDE